MKHSFFKPCVGKSYSKGIRGKRVTVIGASTYCDQYRCPYFNQCTDTKKKDSSAFDKICPCYTEQSLLLSNEPKHNIENRPIALKNFAQGVSMFIGSDDYDTIFDHLAFTEYVQFVVPGEGDKARGTHSSDLSERDFRAFIETMELLKPHIVIVWGCGINFRLKEQNEYRIQNNDLIDTDGYVCHLQIPGIEHSIALLNCYHPSSSAWNMDINNFENYFNMLLTE